RSFMPMFSRSSMPGPPSIAGGESYLGTGHFYLWQTGHIKKRMTGNIDVCQPQVEMSGSYHK
ncbi:MAG: hypothetical protein WCK89_19235, partial [bacterium]